MKTIFFAAAMLGLLSPDLSAQLSGTYQIGGPGSDFSSPSVAVAAMGDLGIDGPVVFEFYPGSYSSFSINGEIAGAGAGATVTFISQLQDAESVTITGGVSLCGTAFVRLEHLTFVSNPIYESSTVLVAGSDEFYLGHCILRDKDDTQEYDDNEALLKLTGTYSGITLKGTVAHCQVESAYMALVYRGSKGDYEVNSCRFDGPLDEWADYFLHFIQDTFYIPEYADDPTFFAHTVNHCYFDFTGTIQINVSNQIAYCYINGPSRLSCSDVWGNTFAGEMDMFHLYNGHVAGNTFLDDVDLSFCHGKTFAGNKVYGQTDIDAQGGRIFKNLFLGDLIIGNGPGYEIYFNNMAPGTWMYSGYNSARIFNNNISNLSITNKSLTELKNNNYFPTEGIPFSIYFDISPLFYDPEYVDPESDLRSTNPALGQKAKYVALSGWNAQDFDGVYRPIPASIGAHELCLESGNLPDTVSIRCGDFLSLNECDSDSLSWWEPSGQVETFIGNLRFRPDSSGWAYLMDTVQGPVDSIYIEQTSPGFGHTRNYYGWCGDQYYLGTIVPEGATCQWEPEFGLSDPAVATPIAEFSDTLTYLAHISLGDCGGWTDTIHLWVIQAPRAYFVWDSTVVETVYFTNYSTCADSYLWDFGDGQVSTAETPVHSYATEGEHLVTLVVENFYGRDTFQRTVYSLLDGVTDRPGDLPVQIFPNPAKDFVHIEPGAFPAEEMAYRLLDARGAVWSSGVFCAASHQLDLRQMPPGVYFLELRSGHNSAVRKLLIHQ